MVQRAAVILAAGQGTRMKSRLPKVLHKVAGRAMVDWSIDLARRVGCERIVVVISKSSDALRAHITERLGADAIAIQDPPQGTGHAVQAAETALEGFKGDVVVLYGDTPLIPATAIEGLFGALDKGAAVGVLGFEAADPGAYGRLILDAKGDLEAIVEAKEASPEQLAVRTCNSGVLACRADRLFRLLGEVTNDNAKGEYYLTDVPGLSRAEGGTAKAVFCREDDVMGVNSRVELAVAESAYQARRRQELLASGVTMTAPDTVWLSHDTLIEPDVIIEPNVVFGPGVSVASGSLIKGFCHIEGARIGQNCEIGPHARLRPGAVLEEKAKVGNFVEVKKTRMGKGAKANHLSYLGDGDVGEGANIGAGTIFCNYDGYFKYETRVGKDAFVGSNSALVAPIIIGEGAMVGSGSVITKDVRAGALALGRGQQTEKKGWATRFREVMSAKKAKGK